MPFMVQASLDPGVRESPGGEEEGVEGWSGAMDVMSFEVCHLGQDPKSRKMVRTFSGEAAISMRVDIMMDEVVVETGLDRLIVRECRAYSGIATVRAER